MSNTIQSRLENELNSSLLNIIQSQTNNTSQKSKNGTEADGASDLSRFSRPLLTVAAILTVFIMIIGISGNLLTVIALLKCPKVRNVAAAFIISLCFADFLFCVVVLPFNAFRFIQGTWTHGDFLCVAIPFIQYGNIGVSLLCITMITINRYIMIAHHSNYSKIYRTYWIALMILFCWLFSYGMQFPTLFKVWGEFGYDSNLGTCSILPDQNGRTSKTLLFIIAFVIPCIIIIICYARIFWVVHKSEKRMRKHSKHQHTIPNNLRVLPSATNMMTSPTIMTNNNNNNSNNNNTTQISPTTSTSISNNKFSSGDENNVTKSTKLRDQRDAKQKRNEWRITKMVLAIFLSFCCCYLPITIAKIADPQVQLPGLHILGYIMLYLSSCMNPIIYVIMNKQYRQAYKTILMCKTPRLLSFTNVGSSIGEKWKDIGYSYNHSRTMVSQVSIADPLDSCNRNFLPMPQDSPHRKRLTVIQDNQATTIECDINKSSDS